MQKQQPRISEVKLHIRGLGKIIADLEQQIADLKRERYFFEQFIVRDKSIQATRKKNLTENWTKKLKHGQRHRKNVLKSVMEV